MRKKTKKRRAQVFKLQRPILTSGGAEMVLAYNRNESAMGQFPMEKKDLKTLFGREFKVFVLANHREDGQIVVLKKVEDPGW